MHFCLNNVAHFQSQLRERFRNHIQYRCGFGPHIAKYRAALREIRGDQAGKVGIPIIEHNLAKRRR